MDEDKDWDDIYASVGKNIEYNPETETDDSATDDETNESATDDGSDDSTTDNESNNSTDSETSEK